MRALFCLLVCDQVAKEQLEQQEKVQAELEAASKEPVPEESSVDAVDAPVGECCCPVVVFDVLL